MVVQCTGIPTHIGVEGNEAKRAAVDKRDRDGSTNNPARLRCQEGRSQQIPE